MKSISTHRAKTSAFLPKRSFANRLVTNRLPYCGRWLASAEHSAGREVEPRAAVSGTFFYTVSFGSGRRFWYILLYRFFWLKLKDQKHKHRSSIFISVTRIDELSKIYTYKTYNNFTFNGE